MKPEKDKNETETHMQILFKTSWKMGLKRTHGGTNETLKFIHNYTRYSFKNSLKPLLTCMDFRNYCLGINSVMKKKQPICKEFLLHDTS